MATPAGYRKTLLEPFRLGIYRLFSALIYTMTEVRVFLAGSKIVKRTFE